MKQEPILIYYADDDQDDRFLFEEALPLTKTDTALHTFENGLELEKALLSKHHKPDYVFLDLNMPLRNGIETLQSLQRDIQEQGLKVIIFTTSDNPSHVQTTYKLGARLFVQKPSGFPELVKTLDHLLTANSWPPQPEYDRFLYKLHDA